MSREHVGDANDDGHDQPQPQDVRDESETTEDEQQQQRDNEQHGDLQVCSPVVIAAQHH
jgi:uncharacterized protein (DUF2345 family)